MKKKIEEYDEIDDLDDDRDKRRHKSPIFYLLLICFIAGIFWQREEIVIGAREWGLFLVDYAADTVTEVAEKYFDKDSGSDKETAKWIDTESPGNEGTYLIAYDGLDEETKDAYEQIYDGIMDHDKRIHMHTKDMEVIEKAFQAVMADHGGLYWVFGYQYKSMGVGGSTVAITFEPGYTMKEAKRAEYKKKIDTAVKEFLKDLPADADDYEKSRYVYETLINKVEYNRESENNQNIISVFLGKSTVCQGYSDAAAYLFEKLGIPCMIVTGIAGDEAHAWNIVKLDDEYYHFDVTWGNSRFRDLNATEKKRVDYAYLNVTTAEILMNHTIDMKINVPFCSGIQDNYYHKSGHYFDTFSKKKIGKVLSRDHRKKKKEVSLRFSDVDILNKTRKYFIDDGKLDIYCPGVTHISYLINEETNVLTIQF